MRLRLLAWVAGGLAFVMMVLSPLAALADSTTEPTEPNPPSGTNLSIGAGADGSSKASGTSYGNAIDGDASTYWSPSGSTGTISVKWGTSKTVSSVVIRTASGGGTRTGSGGARRPSS